MEQFGGDIMGGFCPGGFCPRGDFVQGDFVRGFCRGGFVRGDFVLEPHATTPAAVSTESHVVSALSKITDTLPQLSTRVEKIESSPSISINSHSRSYSK